MPILIPTSLQQATEMLSSHPEAHLLTGGTDLMVEVNFNHRRPDTVLSVAKLPELHEINIDSQFVTIGAAVPYSQMEYGAIATALPALAEAARTVGSPQIRAAGSLGGNLGTCSPAGDSLPVLSSLNAIINLTSVKGIRSIPFSEFMTGPKKNCCQKNEIITSVTIPRTNGWQGYAKVGTRNAMVISVASACLVFHDNSVRLSLGSVGPIIIRCTETEHWLSTQSDMTRPQLAGEFGERAALESRPIDDHRSTAQYRRHAIKILATRLLERGIVS